MKALPEDMFARDVDELSERVDECVCGLMDSYHTRPIAMALSRNAACLYLLSKQREPKGSPITFKEFSRLCRQAYDLALKDYVAASESALASVAATHS